jgi:hypothetical protein
MSGLEVKSRRFLKVEGHRAFRDFNSIHELRFGSQLAERPEQP